jgi:hypothetical protein
MTANDAAGTREKIVELRGEHMKLDEEIRDLMVSPNPDELELRRLKKRKLLVKDQIAALEASLVPDIPA